MRRPDNWLNAEVLTDVQAVDVGVLEAAEDGEANADTYRSIEFVENYLKMSEDSKKLLNNVGDPANPSLESGRNVPMVTDWACPDQPRPGLGRNEPMVLVWTNPIAKPEQPSLEEDWPLLYG